MKKAGVEMCYYSTKMMILSGNKNNAIHVIRKNESQLK